MADNKKIARDILSVVGGKDNIEVATHCMTRLRLNLKDESLIDEEVAKAIDGVLGFVKSGGQNQFIIGQNVDKVYTEFCKMTNVAVQEAVNEKIDNIKEEKLTLKKVGANILNYLAGSLTPLIPLIIAAAMFRTVQMLIGPDMIGLVSNDSDLYILLDFLYDAGFYFFPIYLGYTAAKKIGTSPVLGMLMGGILLAPDFVNIAASGEPFTVYGIPCVTGDYSQSVIPIILTVWVMSYVERFFNKYTPTALRTIFAPFLTVAVMVPISLCLLAPAGNFVGVGIGTALVAFGGIGGFVAIGIIAAFWEYLVMSGMHMILIMAMITTIMQNGYEGVISPAAMCATFAAFGMALGAAIKAKDPQEKSLCIGFFVSGILGGVTEPSLYGVGFKYKRPFIAMSLGAFLGGLYAGITHVKFYIVGAANILSILGFVGGGTSNVVNGVISLAVSMLGAAIATYIIGLERS